MIIVLASALLQQQIPPAGGMVNVLGSAGSESHTAGVSTVSFTAPSGTTKLIVGANSRHATSANRPILSGQWGAPTPQALIKDSPAVDNGANNAAEVWFIDYPTIGGPYDLTITHTGAIGFPQIGVIAVSGAATGPSTTQASDITTSANPSLAFSAAGGLIFGTCAWDNDSVPLDASGPGQQNVASHMSTRNRKTAYIANPSGAVSIGWTTAARAHAFKAVRYLAA